MGNCLYCKMGQQPNFREKKVAVNLTPSWRALDVYKTNPNTSFLLLRLTVYTLDDDVSGGAASPQKRASPVKNGSAAAKKEGGAR